MSEAASSVEGPIAQRWDPSVASRRRSASGFFEPLSHLWERGRGEGAVRFATIKEALTPNPSPEGRGEASK